MSALRLPAAPVQARLWRARATPATPLALEARLSGPLRADVLQAAFAAVRDAQLVKGDVLGTARIAGILAAKRTAELIPLCHPLGLSDVQVRFHFEPRARAIRCEAEVRTAGPTGVEMEALTAVSVALLTIYDMAKSADKGMRIGDVRLLEKDGGKSGAWRATT